MASQVMLLKRVQDFLKNNEVELMKKDYECLEKRLFCSKFLSNFEMSNKVDSGLIKRNFLAESCVPKFFFSSKKIKKKKTIALK